MLRVLFYANSAAALRDFHALAVAMAERGTFEPTLVIQNRTGNGNFIPESPRVPCLTVEATPPQTGTGGKPEFAAAPQRQPSVWRQLRDGLRRTPLDPGIEILSKVVHMRRLERRAAELMSSIRPDVVVSASDRLPQFETALLKVAEDRLCPTLILPVMASSKDSSAMLREDNLDYHPERGRHRWFKRAVRAAFPKQFYNFKGRELSFYESTSVIAMALVGHLPKDPWCVGGGKCDAVALSCERDLKRYLDMGIPQRKIMVTGDPIHDTLYATRQRRTEARADLARQFGWSEGRHLIVYTPPQLAEHGMTDWTTHMAENRLIASALSGQDADVLASLHPKSDPANYRFLEEEFGIAISQSPLSTILICADTYVASSLSSTIEWAIMMEIPTVAIGYLGADERLDDLRCIARVDERDRLGPIVREIVTAGPRRAELLGEFQLSSGLQDRIDGQAQERIITLVERIASRQSISVQ